MSVPPPPTSNQSKMVRSSSFSSQQQTSESAKVNLFACCLLISSLSFGYYCIIKTRNSHSTILTRVTGFCALPLVTLLVFPWLDGSVKT